MSFTCYSRAQEAVKEDRFLLSWIFFGDNTTTWYFTVLLGGEGVIKRCTTALICSSQLIYIISAGTALHCYYIVIPCLVERIHNCLQAGVFFYSPKKDLLSNKDIIRIYNKHLISRSLIHNYVFVTVPERARHTHTHTNRRLSSKF